MIAAERETTITSTDDSDTIIIWTAQHRFINRMHKHPGFKLVRSGVYEGSPWAEFSIPADQWNPLTGVKRQSHMSPEQKSAAGARLLANRARTRAGTPTNT